MQRALTLTILLPILAACPFGGGGPTTCTRQVETAMSSATGVATQTDAGTTVTLQWPATTIAMPAGYFNRARVAPGEPAPRQFTVTSDAGARAEFDPIAGGFSFAVIFPEPDRLAARDTCEGTHGGMDDTIELKVLVSDADDAGTRRVSTSASLLLGAF